MIPVIHSMKSSVNPARAAGAATHAPALNTLSSTVLLLICP